MRRRGSWRRCAGAATETAGVVEVVSCGFAPLSADPLGAGTAFEVKCLLAINSIARADCAKGRLRVDIFLPNSTDWLFTALMLIQTARSESSA
jgi:hypothetical protein